MSEYITKEQVLSILHAPRKAILTFDEFEKSINSLKGADVVERTKIDKTIAQLEDEREFAYANFDEYNEEVLGYDDTDFCERDLCYIGLARAIEILKRNLGG